MTIKAYFDHGTLTNSYLLCSPEYGAAVIVDPVRFTTDMLSFIESQRLELTAALLTQPHAHMLRAIKTIRKIYALEVFAGASEFDAVCCTMLADAMTIERPGFAIDAIPMSAHSRQSFVYRVGHYLFTGSILHAGTLGDTANAYAEALLAASVRDRLFVLGDHMVILPAVGPPSTVRVERRLSPYYYRDGVQGKRLNA